MVFSLFMELKMVISNELLFNEVNYCTLSSNNEWLGETSDYGLWPSQPGIGNRKIPMTGIKHLIMAAVVSWIVARSYGIANSMLSHTYIQLNEKQQGNDQKTLAARNEH